MSEEDDSSCQFAFEKAVEVTDTTNSSELKSKIECETCKGIFFKRHHFNIHRCKRRSKRTCPICQKTFPSPFRLKEHLYLHSGEKPYECQVCKKRFSQKGYLSKHAVMHRKEKPFKCNLCNKSYTQADTLKEHIYTHTGEKPLKCKHCDKSFSNRSSYNMHVSTHENTKTYECDVCLKRFNQKYYLNRHRNIHATEKPYMCDICGKTFSLKAGLNEHMYYHSGKKPYKCDECDKTFTRRTTLSMHREMHNPESSKLPRCDVCNKRFMNKFLLERHHIGVHKKFCLVCDKSSKICICTPEVNQNASLESSVSKKDMFKCQACSEIVSDKSLFMEHVAIRHPDFICLDCDGIYANCDCFKPSMEDYETADDDLKCSLCDKQFFDETRLYDHLLNHKCMVRSMSTQNCSCPKNNEDEIMDDKKNNQIIKCKPLTELKPIDCGSNVTDECDKTFTRRTTSSMHRELQNPESSKLLRCHVCNKRFMNKFLLERHHIGVCVKSSKIYICTPEINENASLETSLSKKDMFKCQACSEIVSDKSLFMEHVASHPDFICLDCGGIYANCDCFKPSMEDCETAEDDLKCSLCDKQFFDETHLYDHLLNHKCMVCSMSTQNCSCPKSNEDEIMDDKKNKQIIKCKPLTELKPIDYEENATDENARGLIKQECDYFQTENVGFGEIGSMEFVEEDLNIKEAFTVDENKPSKIDLELAAIDEESSGVANGVFANGKNLQLIGTDEKPVIINHEFIGDDNDLTDFKPEYVKLEMKPLELTDLINSDNFLE